MLRKNGGKMKNFLIAFLLMFVLTFAGCTFGGGEYGFSEDIFKGEKENVIPGTGGGGGGGSSGSSGTGNETTNVDIDAIMELLTSKFSYDIKGSNGEVIDTKDLDLFAGALLTYKRDYSTQNNKEAEKLAIKNAIENLSEHILSRLASRYGVDPDSSAFLGKLQTDEYLQNYNEILFTNYPDSAEFLSAIDGTSIMEIPLLTGEYSDYGKPVIVDIDPDDPEETITTNLFAALKDLKKPLENYNLSLTVSSSPEDYVFEADPLSNKILKTFKIKVKSTFDEAQNLVVTKMPNSLVPTSPLASGQETTLTISEDTNAAGIYKFECGENTYYLYIGHSQNAFSTLTSPTLLKDTQFDAIRNGWVVDGANVNKASWLWSLKNFETDFVLEYVAKYKNALSLAIAKILMFGNSAEGKTFAEAVPTISLSVNSRTYISARALFEDGMDYALNAAEGKEISYNDFFDFCLNKVDHFGFTSYELDEIAEYVLEFVIGKNLITSDRFIDANSNGTFDNNEGVLSLTDTLIYGFNNNSLRFVEKNSVWKTINFIQSGEPASVTTSDVRGDYFKNYTNITYSILYNIELDAPAAIYYQKFIGDFSYISSVFAAVDEEAEEDFSSDEPEDEGPYSDSLNMFTAGILQSFVLVPNPIFFTSQYSDKILHLISFALQNPNEINLTSILNNHVIVKQGSSSKIYDISGILEDEAWLTVFAFEEPFSISENLTGKNLNNSSIAEYGFVLDENNVADVVYFGGFEDGIVKAYTLRNGEYIPTTDNVVNIQKTDATIAFTYKYETFVYDRLTGALTSGNFTSYQRGDGYCAFLKVNCSLTNLNGYKEQFYISADFDYVEVLFNIDRDYSKIFDEQIVIALYACY